MIKLQKIVTISLLLAFFAVIAGGCGTEEIPDTMDISGDIDFGEDDYQQIVTANNELGFKVLEEVEVDEHGNSFISPLVV